VLSGNVLTAAMNLAAVILTIRYLSLEAFGILTLTLTTMQLVAMLSNAGLNETLMTLVSRAEAAQQRHEVVATLSAMLRLRLMMTAVVVAGGFWLARPVAQGVFGEPGLAFPLVLGVVGACGVSLYQFSVTTLQAFRAYARYALGDIVRFGTILIGVTALAMTGRLDLTAAMAINVSAPFVAFAGNVTFGSLHGLRLWGDPFVLLPRIWDLSKWVWLSNVCSMFFSRLEIYFLMTFTSAAEVGIYSAAFKLCGPILLLEAATRAVLFPEVSRRAGSRDLASFVRRSLAPLTALGVAVWVLGFATAPLIPAVLGQRYAAAAPIFVILLTARVALVPLVPLTLLFFATDRTRAGALAAVTQLTILVAGGLILIPSHGALGAAWTQNLVTAGAVAYMAIFAWSSLASAGLPIRTVTNE
jgi:O-antigen/teichoic acid export membrane protein